MALRFLLSQPIAAAALLHLAAAQSISRSTQDGRSTCTVFAGQSNATDDVPTILQAFEECGHGGNIIFPKDQVYHINSKLNPVVNDVSIDWHGQWLFSGDLDYWRNNSYHISYQNHAAGFVLTGDHILIDGHGEGGIHGNGQLWYLDEAGNGTVGATRKGRPIPCMFARTSLKCKMNHAYTFSSIVERV